MGAILNFIFLNSRQCWFNRICPEMGRRWREVEKWRREVVISINRVCFTQEFWGTNHFGRTVVSDRNLVHRSPPFSPWGNCHSSFSLPQEESWCSIHSWLCFLETVLGDWQWQQRECSLNSLVLAQVSSALWCGGRLCPAPAGRSACLSKVSSSF